MPTSPFTRRSHARDCPRTRSTWAIGALAAALASVTVLTGCTSDEPVATSSTSAPTGSDRGSARASVVVYRTPTCGCCKSYEDYLRRHGYEIRTEVLDDLEPVRADNDVPSAAASCHTVVVDGYAVEGHVPIEAIDKMLTQRPPVDGIGIPGMPTNAPGMGEPDGRPIDVISFVDGNIKPYMTL